MLMYSKSGLANYLKLVESSEHILMNCSGTSYNTTRVASCRTNCDDSDFVLLTHEELAVVRRYGKTWMLKKFLQGVCCKKVSANAIG